MPQDQDDIKGADAMKQAPTPGPLSASRVGTNSGHGHAWKRPDGMKARCGGPGLCSACSQDAALVANVVFAGKKTLAPTAPTAPIEASGSEQQIDLYDDKVQEGIAWTMRQWGEALGLTTWTEGDGSESVEGDVGAEIHTILIDAGLRDPETNEMAALRHQPSGETREADAVALRQARYVLKDLHAKDGTCGYGKLASVCERIADDLQGSRPAPVASGGQHSSGPDEPTEEMIQAALKVDLGAEDERWTIINLWQTMKAAAPVAETAGEAVAWRGRDLDAFGDYTPTEAMVEAGLEHCRPGNHANMVESFMEMMKQAEIDGLITYASPVPAQDDDKRRIADPDAKWLTRWLGDQKEGGHCGEGNVERRERSIWNDRIDRILAALKSTAAQEGGE